MMDDDEDLLSFIESLDHGPVGVSLYYPSVSATILDVAVPPVRVLSVNRIFSDDGPRINGVRRVVVSLFADSRDPDDFGKHVCNGMALN